MMAPSADSVTQEGVGERAPSSFLWQGRVGVGVPDQACWSDQLSSHPGPLLGISQESAWNHPGPRKGALGISQPRQMRDMQHPVATVCYPTVCRAGVVCWERGKVEHISVTSGRDKYLPARRVLCFFKLHGLGGSVFLCGIERERRALQRR